MEAEIVTFQLIVPQKINAEYFNQVLDQTERSLIMTALSQNQFNKSKTAIVLGMDRKSLYNRMSKLNIK